MPSNPLDVLAIAAHRDDVEQTCGGTLLKMAEHGHRTGILDLTQGEMGTRGTSEDRAREAAAAARILKVAWRQALDIPDGRVENTWENRLKVARVIRAQRPRVVVLPYWEGRHPDHYTTSILGYEACFLSGLSKLVILSDARAKAQGGVEEPALRCQPKGPLPLGAPSEGHDFSRAETPTGNKGALAPEGNLPPHRPFKIVYASLYHDVRPTFVVDITAQFESRLQSIYAYQSQFTDQEAGRGDFPEHDDIRDRVAAMARFYGMLAGVKYAEPFVQKEVGLVDDLTAIPVKSI